MNDDIAVCATIVPAALKSLEVMSTPVYADHRSRGAQRDVARGQPPTDELVEEGVDRGRGNAGDDRRGDREGDDPAQQMPRWPVGAGPQGDAGSGCRR